jgi:uncharacterized membrane protein YkoI
MFTTLLKSLAVVALSATTSLAQGLTVKEDAPGLLKRAKVTPEAAQAAARARMPGGTIKAAEIEMEKGKLIYSFDIVTTGKPGVDEVTVDAMTGAVLGVEHESPADEAKERAKDAAKAAKGAAKPAASTKQP